MTHHVFVPEENVLSACIARTYTGLLPPPRLYIYTLGFHTISTMIQQYKLRGEICVGFATLFSYVLPCSLLLRHQPHPRFAAVMILIFVHVSFLASSLLPHPILSSLL